MGTYLPLIRRNEKRKGYSCKQGNQLGLTLLTSLLELHEGNYFTFEAAQALQSICLGFESHLTYLQTGVLPITRINPLRIRRGGTSKNATSAYHT